MKFQLSMLPASLAALALSVAAFFGQAQLVAMAGATLGPPLAAFGAPPLGVAEYAREAAFMPVATGLGAQICADAPHIEVIALRNGIAIACLGGARSETAVEPRAEPPVFSPATYTRLRCDKGQMDRPAAS